MSNTGEIIRRGCCCMWCLWCMWCLCVVFFGCVVATLTLPCHVTKDASWAQAHHVNCSYRRLTTVPLDLPVHTTTLLLNNNDISKLEHKTFSNLTELRHLDLSENNLHSNQLAPDTFNAQGSLQYLDLSYNAMCLRNDCLPQRLFRPLRSLKVFKVTGKTQRCNYEYPLRSLSVLQALTELHISGIPHDIPSDIARFKNLQILDLYDGYIPNISNATFRALSGTNISTLSLRDNRIMKIQHGSFSNLPNLRNLNIAHNKHIGFKVLIRVMWRTENSGIDSLVMDRIAYNEANVLTFQDVCNTSFAKKLRRLSIRYNSIIGIDGKYFGKCLPNVEWLNVGYNNVIFVKLHGLSNLDMLKTFPPRLVMIDLSHYGDVVDGERSTATNRQFDDEFRRPPTHTFNDPTETISNTFEILLDELSERVNFSLDISNNPLLCQTCASLGFLRWVRTTNVRVVARDTLMCTENHELRVVSVSLEDVEASCATATPGVSLLIMFTVAGGVGFCSLTLLLFLYVNRWRMRWYYYSIKRHWRQDDPSTDDAGQYRYDACVVYADDDLDWVAHELVDQVETDWALSLFVSLRDAPAGCPIAENIVQSLEISRYVLFVLTPDFCDDHWCDFSLNMALQRDQTSLILLYIKPIAHGSVSRTLRALLSPRTRCTLIERGDGACAQSLFWQRLHDTLLPTTDSDMLLYRLAPCTRRPPILSD
ncbi:hypothetical protein LSAT2_031303 [Lamellibrachia satsuma]|nr:hypothetical protein LSAT2_031303 [Lamellibrachia satsuma]